MSIYIFWKMQVASRISVGEKDRRFHRGRRAALPRYETEAGRGPIELRNLWMQTDVHVIHLVACYYVIFWDRSITVFRFSFWGIGEITPYAVFVFLVAGGDQFQLGVSPVIFLY